MKNLKYLLLVLVGVILVSGCGSVETLSCSNTESSNGLEMKQAITMTFKTKGISAVEFLVSAKPTSDFMKQNWDIVSENLEGTYDNLNGLKGITIKENSSSDSYSISIKVDLNKADSDSLSEIGLSDIVGATDTIDEVRKSAEADGFTCK